MTDDLLKVALSHGMDVFLRGALPLLIGVVAGEFFALILSFFFRVTDQALSSSGRIIGVFLAFTLVGKDFYKQLASLSADVWR
jgi:flagellar biosynthesis protein FliQ